MLSRLSRLSLAGIHVKNDNDNNNNDKHCIDDDAIISDL